MNLDAVKIAEEKYNLIIDSSITDNDFTARKSGRDSMLIDFGCMAHGGNLFVKDVRNGLIFLDVHNIMVTFRDVQLQAKICLDGGQKLYIKGVTR